MTTRYEDEMNRLIIPVFAVALSGCGTQYTATDAKKVADAIGHIEPSRRDTCETQRQVAAQSSRIETIKAGKEVVYKAPVCPETKS